MDELARISKELGTLDLLIVHYRLRPDILRELAPIRARLVAEQKRLQALRAIVADHI